jgi:hypothetical protein
MMDVFDEKASYHETIPDYLILVSQAGGIYHPAV